VTMIRSQWGWIAGGLGGP